MKHYIFQKYEQMGAYDAEDYLQSKVNLDYKKVHTFIF